MRLAIMDTNAFNTIIAAVKGAVSASISRPMYKNIRLEFRKKNKAVTAIATDGVRLFVEHATCCEVEEDFDCYIKPSIRLPRGNSMPTYQYIAEALGVTVGTLLGETGGAE